MDVARFEAAFGNRANSSRRRFDHAVDNSGDSFGLVADWVTVTRRRRSYSPAAGGSGSDSNYQPRHRSQSRLIHINDPCYLWLALTADNTDDYGFDRSLLAGP